MTAGIYRFTIGTAFYYGSSKDIAKRIFQHQNNLTRNAHENSRVQNTWNKYGEFQWELIEECDPSCLVETEQRYLDEWYVHPNCMNLQPVVGSNLRRPTSDETKEKLRITSTGKRRTPEQRERIRQAKLKLYSDPTKRKELSESMRGRVVSEETRKKISDSLKGVTKGIPKSEETRSKISKGLSGKPKSAQHRKRMSEVRVGVKRRTSQHSQSESAD